MSILLNEAFANSTTPLWATATTTSPIVAVSTNANTANTVVLNAGGGGNQQVISYSLTAPRNGTYVMNGIFHFTNTASDNWVVLLYINGSNKYLDPGFLTAPAPVSPDAYCQFAYPIKYSFPAVAGSTYTIAFYANHTNSNTGTTVIPSVDIILF